VLPPPFRQPFFNRNVFEIKIEIDAPILTCARLSFRVNAAGRVATRLPAQDLQRARAFYAEKLGLEPSEERPGGLLYKCPNGEFALYQSAGASPGTFTQMGFTVDDIVATVTELLRRGVIFEEVDLPG